jgi:hypothetical protein
LVGPILERIERLFVGLAIKLVRQGAHALMQQLLCQHGLYGRLDLARVAGGR